MVPVRRRLQRDERLASADRRRRPVRLARSASSPTPSCSRASATEPAWSARAGARAGDVLLVTNTSARPGRYHYEEAHRQREPRGQRGRTGVAVFKDDFQTIRALAERDNANIQHWSEFERGGHFAVLENPDAIVDDLVRVLRRRRLTTPGSPRPRRIAGTGVWRSSVVCSLSTERQRAGDIRRTLSCRLLAAIQAMAASPRAPMAARNSPGNRVAFAVTSSGSVQACPAGL